jgi:enamine deaminase RidA (YjgF/YER057c/UK114 family)
VFIDLAFLDLADLPEVNALYAELFPEGRRPARTVYQVAALPYGGKVKVQGVAVRQRSG